MKESDIVATMAIHYTSDGEGAVVAGANAVAAAQDKVAASANALATATESSARRQASAQAGFDALVRKTDPAARALFELQKNYDLVTRALSRNQNPAMIDAANRALDVYRSKLTEAEAAQKLFFGSMSGKTIDLKLNVDSKSMAGSARASAEAFMAQFGGLDGLVQAKAAQIGQQFGAALDASMIAGVSKSARESATVFTAELDRLDSIAAAKAGQAGRQFGESLDASLIAGVSKSARDSAAVFTAEMDRLDAIAQAKATQIGKNFQEDLNNSFNIGSTPKSAAQSADVFKETIIAQEDAVNRLRAAINPLQVEQGKLGAEMANYRTLLQQGKISATEYAAAQEMAGRRLGDFANNLRVAGTAGRVMSGEMANLGFQLNDIVTGLALGQSPFMILAQQGGQVFQIFQQSKSSIADFAASAFTWVRSLISVPTAIAAIVTGFVALDYAISKIGEGLETVKKRFEGIAGIKLGDQYAKGLEGLSRSLGTTTESVQQGYEALVRLGQLKMPRDGVQIVGWGTEFVDKALFSAEKLGDAYKTVFQQLRLGGASAAQAAAATNTFFESVSKSGQMTGKDLEVLYKAAPQAAQSITNVLTRGKLSADKFIEVLDKTPISFGKLLEVVRKNGPEGEAALKALGTATDAAYQKMIDNPRNVEDAWTKLEMKIKDVWRAISGESSDAPSGQGHVSFLAQGISLLADYVASKVPTIKQGMDAIKDTFDPAKQSARSWGEVLTDVSTKNSLFVNGLSVFWSAMVKLGATAWEALAPFAPAFVSAFDSATSAMAAFGAKFDSWMAGLLSSAWDYAKKIASAVANMMPSGDGGIGTSNQPFVAATDSYVSPGAGVGSSEPGGSHYDYASAVAEGTYPAFATGGSFTVSGNGGVDSQLVQFWATPGEQVTVVPPGGKAVSGSPQIASDGKMKFAEGGSFTVEGSKTLGDVVSVPADHSTQMSADLISAHFDKSLKDQTLALSDVEMTTRNAVTGSIANASAQIIAALKTITVSGSAATSGSAGSSGSSIGGGSSIGAGSSVGGAGGGGDGGGGGDAFKSIKQQEAAAEKRRQEMQREQDAVNQAYQSQTTAAQRQADAYGYSLATGQRLGSPIPFAERGGKSSSSLSPGNGIGADGLIHPPGIPVDQFGMPIQTSSGFPGGLSGGAAGLASRSGLDYGKSEQAIKQQTDALKQSQVASGKTVADRIVDQTQDAKAIGDTTNRSLGGVEKASQDSLKSLGGVEKSSQAVEKASQDSLDSLDSVDKSTQAGTDATTSGFDQMGSSLGAVDQGVGQATQAVSSGSSSIVESVNAAASSIATAVSNAMSSISNGMSNIANAVSSAVANAASNSSSSSGDYSSDYGSGGSFDPGAMDYGGGSSSDDYGYFASGGQFTVQGAGGTDSQYISFGAEKGGVVTVTPPGGIAPPNPTPGGTLKTQSGSEPVHFWATPGEVVTITPPGHTPPKNPAVGPMVPKAVPHFATGGQLTLGDAFGLPSVSLSSASLINAHASETMLDQTAALKTKVGSIGQSIVQAISDSTSSIMAAVTSVANGIPDPQSVTAFSSGGSGSSPTPTSNSGGWGANEALNGNQYFDNSNYFNNQPGGVQYQNNTRIPGGSGWANGGQFAVDAPRFATGGQLVTEGPGFEPADPKVGTEDLATAISHKVANSTLSVKDSLDSMGHGIVSALNGHTNTIVTAVNAIGDRFNAYRAAQDAARSASARRSSSSSSSGSSYNAGVDEFGRDRSIGNTILAYGGTFGTPIYDPRMYGTGGPLGGGLGANGGYYAKGGQFTAGYMADGGVFAVPGGSSGSTGGMDSMDVRIKAYPGERIIVMSPKEARELDKLKNIRRINPEPLSTFMPSLQDNSPIGRNSDYSVVGGAAPQGPQDGRAAGRSETKTVNIFVQEGRSADTFIRSRAEIQRAMR